jgi:hypothetical protein
VEPCNDWIAREENDGAFNVAHAAPSYNEGWHAGGEALPGGRKLFCLPSSE